MTCCRELEEEKVKLTNERAAFHELLDFREREYKELEKELERMKQDHTSEIKQVVERQTSMRYAVQS